MPLSIWHGMEDCLQAIVERHPSAVLDAGIGFGLWGALLRQYLDVWSGRVQPAQWTARIDGIEIDERRVQPHARLLYTEILVGDIRELVPRRAGIRLGCLTDTPWESLGRGLDDAVVHRLLDGDLPAEELSVELAGLRGVAGRDVEPCGRPSALRLANSSVAATLPTGPCPPEARAADRRRPPHSHQIASRRREALVAPWCLRG